MDVSAGGRGPMGREGDWRRDELSDSDLEVVVGGLARAWVTAPEVAVAPPTHGLVTGAPDGVPKPL